MTNVIIPTLMGKLGSEVFVVNAGNPLPPLMLGVRRRILKAEAKQVKLIAEQSKQSDYVVPEFVVYLDVVSDSSVSIREQQDKLGDVISLLTNGGKPKAGLESWYTIQGDMFLPLKGSNDGRSVRMSSQGKDMIYLLESLKYGRSRCHTRHW